MSDKTQAVHTEQTTVTGQATSLIWRNLELFFFLGYTERSMSPSRILSTLLRLSLVSISIISALTFHKSTQADVGMGLNLGMTYRTSYSDTYYSYQGGVGFPSFGISALGLGRKLSMRSYFDYATYKLSFSTPYTSDISNTIMTWMTFATFQIRGQEQSIYFGPGGGFGYERTTTSIYGSSGSNVGYPFVGIDVGIQINKMIGLDARAFVVVAGEDIWKRWYSLIGATFLIFTGAE